MTNINENESALPEDKPAPPFKVASSHRRTIAFLLDFILFLLLARVSLLPVIYPENWDLLAFDAVIRFNVFYYLGFFIIYLSKDFWHGQSLGKWFFKIRVAYVQEGLPAPSFLSCWGRNLFLIALPVEIGFFLFDKLHRRLGDRALGTVVIVKQETFVVRTVTNRVLAILLCASFLWVAYTLSTPSMIAKSSFYHAATTSLTKGKLKELVIPPYKIGYFNEFYAKNDLVMLVLNVTAANGEKVVRWSFKNLKPSKQWVIADVEVEDNN